MKATKDHDDLPADATDDKDDEDDVPVRWSRLVRHVGFADAGRFRRLWCQMRRRGSATRLWTTGLTVLPTTTTMTMTMTMTMTTRAGDDGRGGG